MVREDIELIVAVPLEEGESKYEYQAPSTDKKMMYFHNLVSVFEEFAETIKLDMEDVDFDFKLINEVNIRVDKRKDYYIIFHDTKLNEVREAALTAFWILKFKPFLITKHEEDQRELNINCSFAAYVILSAVREYICRKYGGDKTFSINDEEYLQRFRYSLKYWDLSKESLMMIAETLCENTVHKKGEQK